MQIPKVIILEFHKYQDYSYKLYKYTKFLRQFN